MKPRAAFIPAPKGLNFNHVLVNGLPEYALRMNNLIARSGHVETFPIAALDAAVSPAGTTGKTPFVSGGNQLWIAGSAGIFAYNSGVNAYALTNGRGWATNFNVAGNSYTLFCNGVDTPGLLNGAVWGAAAWTGTTMSEIFQGLMHRGRLYLARSAAPSFWYLAAGAVGGAATEYNYGSLLKKGGFTVAMATLTRDGGSGTEDYLVALTGNGEMVLFSGNDPAAATWIPIGVWDVGRPASKETPEPNVFVKHGGDLLLFTEKGVYSVAQIISGKSLAAAQSLSWQIDPVLTWSLRANLRAYMQILPTQKLLLLHLGDTPYKFVLNLETGEWSSISSSNVAYYVDHWIEWGNTGQPTKIFGFLLANTNIYELFIKDVSTAIISTVPAFQIWTQYSRLGQIEDLQGISIRPHIYMRGVTDSWDASNNPTFTIGCAYDLSSDYNEQDYNKSTAAGKGAFVQAGHFAYDWDLTADMASPNGRKSRAWQTVAQEVGSSISIQLKSGNSTATKLTRIHGFDLRYTPVELQGP